MESRYGLYLEQSLRDILQLNAAMDQTHQGSSNESVKNWPSPASFSFILVFSNIQCNFYNK